MECYGLGTPDGGCIRCITAQDLIGTLDMDLDGNPTSEMGHAMLRLFSFAEVRDTPSSGAFMQKLRENSFSDEFQGAYDDLWKNLVVEV